MESKIRVHFTVAFILFSVIIGTVCAEKRHGFRSINNPLEESEWEQVVDDGFENSNNVYAWSMEVYGNYLYVGTRNFKDGCQIFRSSSGDKDTWLKVANDGFDPENKSEGARNMLVYNNLLWVVTESWKYGTQVWVTNGEDDDSDGILNWRKANENGFGHREQMASSRSIAVYKGNIYVGARNRMNYPCIYRYDGPIEFEELEPENWSLINEDWRDNPDHNPDLFLPGEMISFNGSDGAEYLYVGVYSDLIPIIRNLVTNHTLKNFLKLINFFSFRCEIWRFDGNVWEEVVNEGFGTHNIMAISSQIYNGTLYFGTHNFRGAEIWETTDGANWTRIVDHGFGKPYNTGMWSMHTFENSLIVGTQNPLVGCQIWASTNPIPKSNDDFIQINKNGMEKKIEFPLRLKQDGVRTFVTFNNYLYAGTASWIKCAGSLEGPGCEVWRLCNIPEN